MKSYSKEYIVYEDDTVVKIDNAENVAQYLNIKKSYVYIAAHRQAKVNKKYYIASVPRIYDYDEPTVINDSDWMCPYCSKVFTTSGSCHIHIRQQHESEW